MFLGQVMAGECQSMQQYINAFVTSHCRCATMCHTLRRVKLFREFEDNCPTCNETSVVQSAGEEQLLSHCYL